jgi:hypothetical protein
LAVTGQTISQVDLDIRGKRKLWRFNITCLGTYTTGGDDWATLAELKAALGASEFTSRARFAANANVGGYVLEQSGLVNQGVHVKVYRQSAATSALTEIPNATNMIGIGLIAHDMEIEGY